MSNEIYPALPGLAFGVRVSPVWQTAIRTTPSGREFRSSQQIYPRYKRRLAYEFLRSKSAYLELQALQGFFNRHSGQLQSFLLDDPDDNTIADQTLGVGNGSTVAWQALRTRGGYTEPIYELNGTPALTLSDWQGDRTALWPYLRTNLVGSSEALTNTAVWTRASISMSGNVGTAPDGSATADKLTPSTSSTGHNVSASITVSPNLFLVNSCYFKAGEYSQCYMSAFGAGVAAFTISIFDLAAGTVLSGPGTITPIGSGWYRCSIPYAASAAGGAVTCTAGAANGGTNTFAGDGTSGIYLWGFQSEICGQAGSASAPPSRYISTGGGTVAVSYTDYSYTVHGGVFTLATAPAAGSTLRWSGSYYWRCRFAADQLDFEKFLDKIWQASQVDLITVKT